MTGQRSSPPAIPAESSLRVETGKGHSRYEEVRALEDQMFELAAELLRQGFALRRLARAQLEYPEHHYSVPRVTERV